MHPDPKTEVECLLKEYPVCSDPFRAWLCGFIDAEGHLSVTRGYNGINPLPYYSARCTIRLRIDDWPLLSWLRAVAGVGYVRPDKGTLRPPRSAGTRPNGGSAPTCHWIVSRYPELAPFIDLLRVDTSDGPLAAAWLVGLIDGDASFAIRPDSRGPACGLYLPQRADNADMLLQACQQFGLGGVRFQRAYETSAPQARWQIGSQKDCLMLCDIINDVGLRGKKRHEFPLWQQAVHVVCGSADMDTKRMRLAALKADIEDLRRFDWSFDWEAFFREQKSRGQQVLALDEEPATPALVA